MEESEDPLDIKVVLILEGNATLERDVTVNMVLNSSNNVLLATNVLGITSS